MNVNDSPESWMDSPNMTPDPERLKKPHKVRNTILGIIAIPVTFGIAIVIAAVISVATGHDSQPATASPAPSVSSSAPASPAYQTVGGACSPKGTSGVASDGSQLTCIAGKWNYPVQNNPAPAPDQASSAPAPNVNIPRIHHHRHVRVCVGHGILRVCS